MKITKDCAAFFNYILKDSAGNLLDQSENGSPLGYIHGLGHIIPGLEKVMEGKIKGDKFKIEIAPPDAYGDKREELVQVVPRDQFPESEDLELGMQFQVDSPQGPFVVTVTELKTESVTVDGNHPLAGVTLNFDVEVTEVRTATPEELAHGHIHGPGGHHH